MDTFEDLKNRISDRLIAEFPADTPRTAVEAAFRAMIHEGEIDLDQSDQDALRDAVLDDVTGIAALESLLIDPATREILVNGHKSVFVDQRDQLIPVEPSPFRSEQHLMRVVENIAAMCGRRVDASHPIVDLRLSDGTLVHIVIPPIAMTGPSIVLRKMWGDMITAEQLLEFGAWSQQIWDFLRACVNARLNIVVSGGTGTGKTTALNVIADAIDPAERLIVVEPRSVELKLDKPHMVRMQARPANLQGEGEISAQHLLTSAMKMRPDRIILSEAQGAEVLEIIQAMNTGIDGSMFSMHASSPRDALARLEIMATMHDVSVPLMSIRQQMASALHVITYQERMRDGVRRITRVVEVIGIEGGEVKLQDIFEYVEDREEDGQIVGRFQPTGNIPHNLDRLNAYGANLDASFFQPQA